MKMIVICHLFRNLNQFTKNNKIQSRNIYYQQLIIKRIERFNKLIARSKINNNKIK